MVYPILWEFQATKPQKNKYEKSLNETTDQLLSKLVNKKEYEDEVVGKSLKMKIK